MTCSPESIEAYLDDELDANERAATERHLHSCAECSAAYGQLRQQKISIRQAAPYYTAPAEVRTAVRDLLRSETASERQGAKSQYWRWAAIAAGLIAAVSLSWNIAQLRRRPESNLAEVLVADHIRSLIGTHLVDVWSSDRHTVKPWFNGKLDFAPEVKDLQADGFPLVGGRVDYIAGRRVAALVYRRGKHLINVFTWPASSTSSEAARIQHNGYRVLCWTSGAMMYWAVSDVALSDLEHLRNLLGG